MPVEPWSHTVKIPSTVVHAIAIVSTMFRLSYRLHMSSFWWEDTWATLALICDITCLVSVWMQTPPDSQDIQTHTSFISNWLLSLSITSLLWFTRLSILCSIVRLANPTPRLRRVAYCIGAVFLAMDAGLLVQKVFICINDFCRFSNPVTIAQLATDVISDMTLVAAPVQFLRGIKLARNRRILILSVFSASLLISGVTILHSALLLQGATSMTLMIGHVKAALSLIVCDAFVLVTFVYRLCQKSEDSKLSIEEDCGGGVEFTTYIDLPTKLSSCVFPLTSGVHSRRDAALHPDLNSAMLDASRGSKPDPSQTKPVLCSEEQDVRNAITVQVRPVRARASGDEQAART